MKQVLVKRGGVVVQDVPAPQVGPRNVLVRVECSCVSAGTERTSVELSGLPLYRRALKQPHHARRVLEVAREQGFKRTYDRVRSRLDAGLPTGYSAAGVVVEVGSEVNGFAPGDRVVCAGAGVANHAEVISVPVNLAVRAPDEVSMEDASTATLGAIALQGVRRAAPTLGEAALVVGLGIIGQITVQLLRANGCRVIGADLDATRVESALANGMTHGVHSAEEDVVEHVLKLTDGFGCDAAIVTAATSSHDVISQSLRATRKKGRVVLVGDVGLNLNRHDFYEKELDLLVSTSYGPGRYDPVYEEQGQDYPLPYVRWTENRNLEAYLELLAAGQVSLANLPRRTFPVEAAPAAFGQLAEGSNAAPLLVILSYPREEPMPGRKLELRRARPQPGRLSVGLVGAGNFAFGTHIPNLRKLQDRFDLRAVMSLTGLHAATAAKDAGAAYATTDYEELLADEEVDLLLISTRHDVHASLALRGLRAGKHVFVEKPLALTRDELAEIEDFYRQRSEPMLMTGFNRRFSPAIRHAKGALAARTTPMILQYRINAGYLPPDHWVHGPQGGGRNIGEACHVYDVFTFLTEADVVHVEASSIRSASKQWARNDNFVATVSYADGSVCTLTYSALGHKRYSKERMEAYADGRVVELDDYRLLKVVGASRSGWRSRTADKGHAAELRALGEALAGDGRWPISLEDQLTAMRIAFTVEERIRRGPESLLSGDSDEPA